MRYALLPEQVEVKICLPLTKLTIHRCARLRTWYCNEAAMTGAWLMVSWDCLIFKNICIVLRAWKRSCYENVTTSKMQFLVAERFLKPIIWWENAIICCRHHWSLKLIILSISFPTQQVRLVGKTQLSSVFFQHWGAIQHFEFAINLATVPHPKCDWRHSEGLLQLAVQDLI